MTTSWIKEHRILGGKLSLVHAARIAASVIIIILALGCVYGLGIYRANKGITAYIPGLGIAACGLLLYWGCRIRKQLLGSELSSSFTGSPKILILLSLLLIAGTIAFGEWMIVTPGERIHILKYCLLGFFLFYSFKEQGAAKRALFATLLGFATGIAEEGFQYYLPSRVGEVRDAVLDGTCAGFGSLFGWLSTFWLCYRK